MRVEFNGQGFKAEMDGPENTADTVSSPKSINLFKKTGSCFWFGMISLISSLFTMASVGAFPLFLIKLKQAVNFETLEEIIKFIFFETTETYPPSETIINTSVLTEQAMLLYSIICIFLIAVSSVLTVIAIITYTKAKPHAINDRISWENIGIIEAIVSCVIITVSIVGFVCLVTIIG